MTAAAYPHHISPVERQIIDAIICDALDMGYLVSVHDGEEWAIKASGDYSAITREIAATDETMLRIRRPGAGNHTVVGNVWLIHGNGCDVIADYTDSNDVQSILARANVLANRFSAA